MKYDKYTFFFKNNSPFSNWYPCRFRDEVGAGYNCAEQYMMNRKAMLFMDLDSMEKILRSDDPREQKKLGRSVKNFNTAVWNKNAKKIVYNGCKLKFEQNQDLMDELLKTAGTLLVEASPYDRIWGIGLSIDDPWINDPSKWRGTNWLGEVLTELRDDFITVGITASKSEDVRVKAYLKTFLAEGRKVIEVTKKEYYVTYPHEPLSDANLEKEWFVDFKERSHAYRDNSKLSGFTKIINVEFLNEKDY